MRTLDLAKKSLALAVALALPTPSVAGNLARAASMNAGRVASFGAAAPNFHQEFVLKIDSMLGSGADLPNAVTPAALYSLVEVKPTRGNEAVAAADARAQANAFIARVMLVPQETARRELEAAHIPAETIEAVLAAAAGAQERRKTDKDLAKAFKTIASGKAPSSAGFMRKAKSLADTLANAVKKPAAEDLVLAGHIQKIESWGSVRSGGSEGSEPGFYAAAGTIVKSGFVPVAKKVVELKKLMAEDREAAFALAEKILADNAEPRVEVRAAALRAVAEFPAARSLPVLIKAAENPVNWYIQRMAIQMVGQKAADVGALKGQAEKALRASYKSSNGSVRLMSKWSLEKLGLDAGPEVGPTLAESVRGRVPSPTLRKETFAPNNGFGPQNSGNNGGGSPMGRIFKGLLWIAAVAFLFSMFIGNKQPAPNPQVTNPPAVEQSIAPKDAAEPKADAPKLSADERQAKALEEMRDQLKQNELQRQKERAEDIAKAEEKAKASGGPGAFIGSLLFALLPIGLLIGVMVWLGKRAQSGAMSSAASQLSGGKMNLEKPDTRFTDVAGADDALRQIQQVAEFIRNPERYTRLGGKAPKGVMLHGPPGTGKTLMARALAGESDANFISMKGSDFIELFVGVGAGRVRQLFEVARKNAPTIIFIDELDAIGKARGRENISGGSSEHDQTLISLIAELDGFSKMDNVIVVAATNRLDVLDPALMRPGRFDRKIYVGNPDVLGREAILAVHGSKFRLGPDADLEFTARRTSGMSGASMANVLNEAATEGGNENHDSINADDLSIGVDKHIAGERRHIFVSEEIKRRIAYHEAGHVVANMMTNKQAKAPNKVTIIPHGEGALGYAEPAAEGDGDSMLLTQDQLEDRIAGAMGGRAAEEIIYGKEDPKKGRSTGPGSDIPDHADRYARIMVESLGMDADVGIMDAARDRNHPLGGYKVSEKTRELVDVAVRRIIGEQTVRARALLEENLDKVQAIVNVLMERETIYQEEIEAIVYPQGRPKS